MFLFPELGREFNLHWNTPTRDHPLNQPIRIHFAFLVFRISRGKVVRSLPSLSGSFVVKNPSILVVILSILRGIILICELKFMEPVNLNSHINPRSYSTLTFGADKGFFVTILPGETRGAEYSFIIIKYCPPVGTVSAQLFPGISDSIIFLHNRVDYFICPPIEGFS